MEKKKAYKIDGKTIFADELVEHEVFISNDGREFSNEQDAIRHDLEVSFYDKVKEVLFPVKHDGAIRQILGNYKELLSVLKEFDDIVNIKERNVVKPIVGAFANQLKENIVVFARNNEVTRGSVANYFNITLSQSSKLLSELVKGGDLEKHGHKANTKYVIPEKAKVA